ncbi:PREDICTED: protein PAIR1-like, partial [Lupinus angustifolius]|uniref:protein PAIR1-like n=1 Tax=Lupinus angustifolius TaxID=3871 RepID=UPI00092EC1E9
RAGSQEHDNSLRKISNLPRLAYSREESQPPNSRSSSNLIVKWRPEDHKNQLSEGIEYRIGIMETSLSRFAMIFDSVQSDVMQVNKGTKELLLEMEFIRQKLIALDNSIQLLTKGQEEIKASIAGSLKSLSEHMSNQEKLQEVYSAISTLPQLIRKSLQSVQSDLLNTTTEMQEISCTLKSLNQKDPAQSILSSKSISNRDTTSKKRQPVANEKKMNLQVTVVPKKELGGWKPVKKERVTFLDRKSEKVHKENEPYTEKYLQVGRDCAIVIESDEDTDGGFSCLVGKNGGKDLFGKLTREEKEEAQWILQKARRRKRRYSNAMPITIL